MKKKVHTLVYSTALLLTASCSGNGQKQESLIELTDTATISTDFGLPVSMSLYEQYMFVSDFYGEDGLVNVLDLHTSQITHSFARKGEGPNEVLAIGSLDYTTSGNGDSLYLFDPMTQRMKIYAIDSIFSTPTYPTPVTEQKMPSGSHYTEVLRTRNGYIASGIMEDKKFTLLNDSLQECGSGGHYAAKPSENIPDMLNVIANNGKFALSKDRKHIVNIIYIAGIITCYTLDDATHTISLKWENKTSDFDYELKGEAFVNNKVMGYLDICAGDRLIYALYSGEAEDLNASATYGKEVHVYDYDGNLVASYGLSRSAFCICVDEDNNILYAATHEPEVAIVRYALPVASDSASEETAE